MLYAAPGTPGAKFAYKSQYDNFIGGKWVAPTLMKNMIRAGRLGRKTGAGWYEYKK